jgi:hypothetical protein
MKVDGCSAKFRLLRPGDSKKPIGLIVEELLQRWQPSIQSLGSAV